MKEVASESDPIGVPQRPSAAEFASLPQLADPASYAACRWDLTTGDPARREYWLNLFRTHFPSLLRHALEVAAHDRESGAEAQGRAEAARREFFAHLDELTHDPGRHGRLDILAVCEVRERILRRHAFADPYRLAKAREAELALAVLPALLAELDAMPEADRQRELVRGVFAGNIFDLGATVTNDLFRHQSVDFHATRERLKPRPWLFDDLDAWLARLATTPWRNALLFVDNSGPDVLLGMVPFARELARRGVGVILAANTHPSLNDVTHAELLALMDHVGAIDAVLAEARDAGRLHVLADGNGAPLIDLTRLDPAFVRALDEIGGIDLVVLEGMGRAVESNLDARLTCDVLKVAMIKDRGVADALGGSLYDLVFRFEPADAAL